MNENMVTDKQQYLHYIHINKNWYYWFSGYPDKKIYRPYDSTDKIWYFIDDGLTWFACNISRSKARKTLREIFPGFNAILTYPYHKGYGAGSRPYKDTWAKDNYRKERKFKEEQGGM